VTIWRAALAAGDVGPLLRRALRVDGAQLTADGHVFELARVGRVLVLGCGKAAAAMARAVEDILGDRVDDGFVVVKDGHTAPTRRVRVHAAGHPVPDERGVAATEQLLALAAGAGERDLVVFVVSGGGSALTPAPAAPVRLEDEQAVTRLLLAAGATIYELNAVRKHLSRFKGGLLARAAAPAAVLTLALSDVVGDALDVIASGPTAPDPSTFAQALGVLRARGVLDRTPATVRRRLEDGAAGNIEETPKPGDPIFARVRTVIVGNNAVIADAALAEARRLGWRPTLLTRALEGEAREVGRDLVRRCRALPPAACLVAAGETTVTVRGAGRGGRCQEAALSAALAIAGDPTVVLLAGGTDGTDGPTDAAGGLADGGTAARARAAGVDPAAALENNDAYRALQAAGDLLVTGPTNTNLLDLYLAFHVDAQRMSDVQ